MSESGSLPDIPEIGRAGLIAAAAASASLALVVIVLDPSQVTGLAVWILLAGLPIALLHVVLLALPLYMVLRKRWRLCWWNAALGGFLVGVTPSALLILPGTLGALFAHAGVAPGEDSRNLLAILVPGAAGLVGGLAFWARLR